MPLERDDLKFYFDQLNDNVNEVKEQLVLLNGKTNRNTTDIAILFDRADQAKALAATAVHDAKNSGRNHGATWGGIIGGIVIAVYQLFVNK